MEYKVVEERISPTKKYIFSWVKQGSLTIAVEVQDFFLDDKGHWKLGMMLLLPDPESVSTFVKNSPELDGALNGLNTKWG